MLRRLYTLALILLCTLVIPASAAKKSNRSAKGKKQSSSAVIKDLKRNIQKEEKTLREIKKNKASAEEQVLSLTAQIESRGAVIEETSEKIEQLTKEVRVAEKRINSLNKQLDQLEKNIRDIVRAAYRNYRYQSRLTYLFSAKSFSDIANRIVMLRTATDYRQRQIVEVSDMRANVQQERAKLAKRREELAEIKKKLTAERKKMNDDIATLKKSIEKMTSQEKSVLRSKMMHEKRLNEEIKKLRKRANNNKVGSSFAAGAKLNLPVENGKVQRYKGNMAEILGKEGAAITSVYKGKVIEIKRNKVNNKYDVFIAHGKYITSYANLSAVCVSAGQTVAKNQRIGTIGAAFNLSTEKMEYKMVFGIYSPNPNEKLSAAVHFKKK